MMKNLRIFAILLYAIGLWMVMYSIGINGWKTFMFSAGFGIALIGFKHWWRDEE